MSPRSIRFEKWQGLGNDFLVVEAGEDEVSAETAARLCDRHFGVGGDGVLLVSNQGDRFRMIVLNADGSRPEMCGNGLRCVVGYLASSGRAGGSIEVLTDAGPKRCEVIEGREARFEIAVDMGAARLDGPLVVPFEGGEQRFLRVDVGNPHAITFDTIAPWDEALVDRLGPVAATYPPGGTNVEFCRESPGRIAVTVWERGVGRTLACGTGACAVAAAACATGRARFGQALRVALPGGELSITVPEGMGSIRMVGPAARAFTGVVEAAVLA
ncbi:MAG: diaminopimelate epimerase [Byssovorax sp.]